MLYEDRNIIFYIKGDKEYIKLKRNSIRLITLYKSIMNAREKLNIPVEFYSFPSVIDITRY